MRDVGQQSLFDCQRPLYYFRPSVETSTFIPFPECSSFNFGVVRDRRTGGGEGTRTPDPCVANAVLCQLSYTPDKRWLRGRDLNPRPLGYEPNELPDCSTPRQGQTKRPETPIPVFDRLEPHFKIRNRKSEIRNLLVGLGRVELPTSRLSGVRSNQLSYRPMSLLRVPFFASACEFCRKKEPHFS